MDYLQHIEYSVENLHFYLWFKDYERRWNEGTDVKLRALSPDWKPEAAAPTITTAQRPKPTRRVSSLSVMLTRQASARAGNLQAGKSSTIGAFLGSNGHEFQMLEDDEPASFDIESVNDNSQTTISKECTTLHRFGTVQPYRAECMRIVRQYLDFNSPRELNLSHRTRASVLEALQYTTHPSAFLPALEDVELSLRGQSHPNFIRWSICNGNKPRIIFIRSLGMQGIVFALAAYLLLTLSHASRWYRILPALLLFIGIASIVAAYQGLCMVMHHTHSRNLRPWEDVPSTTDIERASISSDNNGYDFELKDSGGIRTEDFNSMPHARPTVQTFGSSTALNDEILVERYQKRSMLHQIFHGDVWTQDETLRSLQNQIISCSFLWAALATFITTVIFVAVPGGNFF